MQVAVASGFYVISRDKMEDDQPPSDTDLPNSPKSSPTQIFVDTVADCEMMAQDPLETDKQQFQASVIEAKVAKQVFRITFLLEKILKGLNPILDNVEISEIRKILAEAPLKGISNLELVKQKKYELFQRLKISKEKLKIDHLLSNLALAQIDVKEAFAISKLIPNECIRCCAFKMVAQLYARTGNLDKALLIIERISDSVLRIQAHGLIFDELRLTGKLGQAYTYANENIPNDLQQKIINNNGSYSFL